MTASHTQVEHSIDFEQLKQKFHRQTQTIKIPLPKWYVVNIEGCQWHWPKLWMNVSLLLLFSLYHHANPISILSPPFSPPFGPPLLWHSKIPQSYPLEMLTRADCTQQLLGNGSAVSKPERFMQQKEREEPSRLAKRNYGTRFQS